jgi:hypothetical protein
VNSFFDTLKKRRIVASRMKTIIPIIVMLVLLIACTPHVEQQKENSTTNVNLTVDNIFREFDALDAQYNTSWKKEHITKSMIDPKVLPQWTDYTLALKNITQKDTLASELIDARLEMLSAQTAVYLSVEIGQKGAVPYTTGENDTIIVGPLNCSNIEDIAKATKLYQVAFHSWQRFSGHMDNVLQYDVAARAIVGIDNNRMPFYESSFQKARKKIEATAKALREQCGFAIKLEPEPEIPPNLQHGGVVS